MHDMYMQCTEPDTHHKVQIGIDVVKKELTEDVGTRRKVALKLITIAVGLKIREQKECNR